MPVTLSRWVPDTVTPLPLCALFAGWLRGQANTAASVQVRAYATDRAQHAAVADGRALRAEIDAVAEPIGVLVVADGSNTLTQAAPGGYDPESTAVQAVLDAALSTGDSVALNRLPASIVGRVAYQVLAGLAGESRWSARELARGAPYGVGYFVGLWVPD